MQFNYPKEATHSDPKHIIFKKCFFLSIFFSLTSTTALAKEPPFKLPPKSEIANIKTAEIITTKGSMIFTLYPDDAPWHVSNFKFRADKGFYNGSKISIVHPGYIVQGGAPVTFEASRPYSLPPEFTNKPHTRGTLGMARRQDIINAERNSDSAQFHILLGSGPHMDGLYTSFGQLRDGDELLDLLEAGDRIERITVYISKAP